MLKFGLFLASLLLLCSSPLYAKSDVIAKLEDQQKEFQKLYSHDPDGCHKVFNILWDDAKKGDLNARFLLLVEMTMMHGPKMLLPGGTSDDLSRQRHYTIMAAHSIGNSIEVEEKKFAWDDIIYTDMFLKDFNQNSRDIKSVNDIKDQKGFGPEDAFGKCIKISRSNECVKLAVEEGVLPSFDDFSKEIDTFIQAGQTARCLPEYPNTN